MDIAVENLTKQYRQSVRALDEVTVQLGTSMVGLLGANGAGKTTLMRTIAGLCRPTSGTVRVGGHDVRTAPGRAAIKRLLGYLPQEVDLYPDLTGRELLDYIGLLKGLDDRGARRRQVDSVLERVGLSDEAKRKVGGYSGGMKRRLGIAQCLLGDPRLIIVDEPTVGLDPEERMRFRSLLASLGGDRTVILSTHILDDVAQTCPRVAVLASGRLAYDGTVTGLVQCARGSTYSLQTSGPAPSGPNVIVNAQMVADGSTMYRLVSDEPPAGAVPVPPNLEDGYVALLRRSNELIGAGR